MIVFDTSHDPLHLQVFPPSFSEADLCAHFDYVEAYFRRRSPRLPTAILTDARGNIASTARYRQRAAQAYERLGATLGRRCVAQAIVMDSAIVRGAVTAVFWLQPPPWPIKTFGSMAEADRWIRGRFVEEGLPPPDAPPDWWTFGAMAKPG